MASATSRSTTPHDQQTPEISHARNNRSRKSEKRARLGPRTDGLLANWNGKDFRKYKWTMLTVMRKHGLDDIALRKLTREEARERLGQACLRREAIHDHAFNQDDATYR
ncbi:hypothetical protein CCR75_008025 [Bremia lactucae]|uniref:Uncharacterized protein n=1 Tax=Bremia lactucae TaxID=4779 RepID=A0A976FPV9_BRELC|nr:hypothetical protein CCR75_008025 [Bremia lactucae]